MLEIHSPDGDDLWCLYWLFVNEFSTCWGHVHMFFIFITFSFEGYYCIHCQNPSRQCFDHNTLSLKHSPHFPHLFFCQFSFIFGSSIQSECFLPSSHKCSYHHWNCKENCPSFSSQCNLAEPSRLALFQSLKSDDVGNIISKQETLETLNRSDNIFVRGMEWISMSFLSESLLQTCYPRLWHTF